MDLRVVAFMPLFYANLARNSGTYTAPFRPDTAARCAVLLSSEFREGALLREGGATGQPRRRRGQIEVLHGYGSDSESALAYGGNNTHNSHSIQATSGVNCSGGNENQGGGGVVLVLGYATANNGINANNSHAITTFNASRCAGGCAALAIIISDGNVDGFQLSVSNSTFENCNSGQPQSWLTVHLRARS